MPSSPKRPDWPLKVNQNNGGKDIGCPCLVFLKMKTLIPGSMPNTGLKVGKTPQKIRPRLISSRSFCLSFLPCCVISMRSLTVRIGRQGFITSSSLCYRVLASLWAAPVACLALVSLPFSIFFGFAITLNQENKDERKPIRTRKGWA